MASTHELVLKLSGKMDSSLSSSFSTTSKLAQKVNDKLSSLNKQKVNFQQYEKINQKIADTAGSLDKANSSLSPLNRSFQESKAKTNELKTALDKAENEVLRLERAVKGSVNPTKEMKAALSLAKIEAKEVKKAFKESSAETSELGKKNQQAKDHVSRLTSDISKQNSELNKLKESFKKAGINANNFAERQKQVSKTLSLTKNVQDSYSGMKGSFQDTAAKGRDLAKTVAVATASFAIPVKLAIDSENAMADVKKVTDFAGKDLVKFEQEMRKKIGTEIPLGFKEYSDLIASAAQSGIKDSELLDFSADAAKMSVAFDIEAGEAGKTMARWRTAFGMTQKEVVALADKVNYLSDNTSASAPEITTIVSKVGALSEVAGMTSGHVAALGASMVSMDVDVDVAGTAIKKMITTLTKAETATKGQKEVYKKLGMTSKEVNQAMQKDAEGTILKVLEGIKKLPKAEQASALSQLFGNESIQAIAPLLTQLDTLKMNFENVNDEANKFKSSMETEYQIRSATAENQLIMLKNNLESIGSSIGKAILPELVLFSQKVNGMAQKFLEWKNNNEGLFNGIIKGIAAFAAFIVVTKGLIFIVSAVRSIIMAVKFLVSVFKLAKFVIGTVTGVISGPLLLAFGLILGAVLAWKHNFLGFRDIVNNVIQWGINKFNEFKNKMQEVDDKIGTLRNNASRKLSEIGESIRRAGNKVKSFFLSPFEKVSSVLDSIKRKASNINLNPISGIKNLMGYAKGGIITRPEIAMVGEGGAHEAIIPLDGSSNARSLWEYAGSRLGLLQRGEKSLKMKDLGSSVKKQTPNRALNANVNFNITINGGGDDIRAQIEEAIQSATPRLKRYLQQLLAEIEHDNRRVRYS